MSDTRGTWLLGKQRGSAFGRERVGDIYSFTYLFCGVLGGTGDSNEFSSPFLVVFPQKNKHRGYAVVRYDTRLLSITPDNRELGWLSDVVSWALGVAPAGTLASSSSSSGPSSGPRQPDLLFTAGHSRGAKLAALQYAGSLEFARCGGEGGGGGSSGASGASGGDDETSFLPKQPLRIASAFLIDPVDNTRFTPASEAYPSAAAALRAQGSEATLAVAAAGKIGACNPLVSGYKHFWPASFGGDASFLLVFKGAGHATFNDAGRLGNKLADWLCGRGDLGREAAMSDAGAAMVSWFDGIVSKVERARSQKLENAGGCDEDGVSVSLENSNSSNGNSEESVRVLIKKRPASPAPLDAAVPSPPTAALQENFYSWARAAAAAGEVEFEVRGGLVPPQPTPQPAPCSAAAAAAAAAGSRTTAAANNVVPFPAAAAASKASAVAPP